MEFQYGDGQRRKECNEEKELAGAMSFKEGGRAKLLEEATAAGTKNAGRQ